MTSLYVSSTQLTFQPNQQIKTIQLINKSKQQPIMYKIKTNKIDYVDAKPSCGYISGKPGHNEISVIIRSLENKKQYTAKLQILYIAHQRITEQVVERNKKHFDINEYNQIYDSIKTVSKNDAKVEFINVIKKIQDTSQDAPVDKKVEIMKKQVKVERISEEKIVTTTKRDNEKESNTIQIEKGKLLNISLVMLLIGLLLGFSLGCKYGHVFGGQRDSNAVQVQLVSQQPGQSVQVHTSQEINNEEVDQKDFQQTDEQSNKQNDQNIQTVSKEQAKEIQVSEQQQGQTEEDYEEYEGANENEDKQTEGQQEQQEQHHEQQEYDQEQQDEEQQQEEQQKQNL